MAPKQSAKVVAKTTRKVVREETVFVAVVAATDQPPAVGENEGKSEEEEEAGEEETPVAASQQEGEERKRRWRRRDRCGGEGYKRYVLRVLKQVHPGMAISSKAMTVLNNLMSDMFERVAEEAARLAKYTGRVTLMSRETQGAVRLVLPGELGKHADAEGRC